MVVCANQNCYNKGSIHVGYKSKVRLLCDDCFKLFKSTELTLKEFNPQEQLFKTEQQLKNIAKIIES